MNKYVAYYRVSTDRQGKSGLGLEAQREAVTNFLKGGGELIGEFTEIESGKRHDNRPQLADAIAQCRKAKAILVIAKLDRLARNVAFIANLMENKVQFVAVDMPQANELMLHIMAAFAQHERQVISKRVTEALAAAKRRGTRLGNPRPQESLERGRATIAQAVATRHAIQFPLISELRRQGLPLRAIADELNKRGIPTARGKAWQGRSVLRELARAQAEEEKRALDCVQELQHYGTP